MTGFISKLVGMIILGVLSAALSYYNKNYFVRVIDDILGREEEENLEAKLGRGFIYGFLFPVYFVLALAGLIALVAFLVVAGILAGIGFLLVWLTEKIIPKEAVGAIVKNVFDQIGIKGPKPPFQPAVAPAAPAPGPDAPITAVTTPTVTTAAAPASESKDVPPAPAASADKPKPEGSTEGGDSTPKQ
jgi:hypothetical protein